MSESSPKPPLPFRPQRRRSPNSSRVPPPRSSEVVDVEWTPVEVKGLAVGPLAPQAPLVARPVTAQANGSDVLCAVCKRPARSVRVLGPVSVPLCQSCVTVGRVGVAIFRKLVR